MPIKPSQQALHLALASSQEFATPRGARLNSNIIGRGSGGSKREAEQNAAREAIGLMGYETN